MTNELMIVDFDTQQRQAMALYASGYFQLDGGEKGKAQAIAKVMAGAELGLPPFASMAGIHIIKSKPVISAGLIATLIERSKIYSFKVVENDETKCVIDFYKNGEKAGRETFTIQDATRAGLSGDNWRKFPKNMLFARAISNGAKFFCAGIFAGSVYTEGELDDSQPMTYETSNDIYVIESEVVTEQPPQIVPAAPQPPQIEREQTAVSTTSIVKVDVKSPLFISLMAAGSNLYAGDWNTGKRAELVNHITNGRSSSAKDLTVDEAQKLLDGINKKLAEKKAAASLSVQQQIDVLLSDVERKHHPEGRGG